MTEIVFGDSACGCLKMAQHYGDGNFHSGAIGVIIEHSDGSRPTQEEIQAARREAEERERIAWEKAVPMGGNAADVYAFPLGLSIGDISENIPGEKRLQVLRRLYDIYRSGDEDPIFTKEEMKRANDTLQVVCGRILAGERVRIWYSNKPDELCGMYWFMTRLHKLKRHSNPITLVQLPDYAIDAQGNFITFSGWGSVGPGEWQGHLHLQKEVPVEFCKGYAARWHALQQENAPLRAVLNGQLMSVAETFYDEFIRCEIAREADVFHEAAVVGSVLGKYDLGVSDAFIAQRIESMIGAGSLTAVTQPPQGRPLYHRRLKKCGQV